MHRVFTVHEGKARPVDISRIEGEFDYSTQLGDLEKGIKKALIEDEEANSQVEEPSMLPNQRMGIIMIGLFGDQNNVSKLVRKLYDAGFEPYLEEKGQFTRVGIQFAYETQAEIDEKLRIVQDRFEEDAVVWRK